MAIPAGQPRQRASSCPERQVEVVRDAAQMLQLEPAWRWLWERTPSPPPMLEFTWIQEWWRLHASHCEPFLVLLREGERVVGLAPLYIRRRELSPRGWLRSVCLLGTGEAEAEELYSSANGWLGCVELREEITGAVVQALTTADGCWDRLDLRNLGPEPDVALALEAGLAPLLSELQRAEAPSHRARLAPLDEYLGTLASGNHRSAARRALRKAEAAGVEFVVAETEEQATGMFRELVALHQAQWEARGLPGACASSAFREFHERLVPVYQREGRVWLAGLRLDGEWIALHYDLLAGDTVYLYVTGVAPELGRKLAAGNVLTLRVAERAAEAGLRFFDLLPGTVEYKRRIANECVDMTSLQGLGNTAAATAWRALRGVKERVRRWRASDPTQPDG